MSDDAARAARLRGLKLRALVRDHLGDADVPPAEEFAPGAALVHESTAWLLVEDQPAKRLGAAVLWASRRRGVDRVALVAEVGTGVLARRARHLAADVTIWHAEGRCLLPAVAEPLLPPDPAPRDHEVFRDLIVAGGAEPNVEHGVLVGEVRGLEVCRVVDDADLGTTRLEVGVGAHDREAFQMLHGDVPAVEALARIVAVVESHRRVGAPRHPLNRLAAERFLRWRLVDDPSLASMRAVAPSPPPVARDNLKDAVPCVATAVSLAGEPAVIVCSSGVDLDLVPFAADAREAIEESTGVEHALVLALPARDRVRATDELAAQLIRPASLVPVD